jgi:hypothetical protein
MRKVVITVVVAILVGSVGVLLVVNATCSRSDQAPTPNLRQEYPVVSRVVTSKSKRAIGESFLYCLTSKGLGTITVDLDTWESVEVGKEFSSSKWSEIEEQHRVSESMKGKS